MTTTEALDQMRKVIRMRHLSLATERSYAGWVARFGAWLIQSKFQGGVRSPLDALASSTLN